MQVGEVPAHLERDHRNGQDEPNPKPPGHVDQLGIGARLRGREHRLERHAANRTTARTGSTDLGVHWAGIDGAWRNWWGRRLAGFRTQIFSRVGRELGLAPGGAEIVGLSRERLPVRGNLRIDRHAADRIAQALGGACVMMPRAAVRAAARRLRDWGMGVPGDPLSAARDGSDMVLDLSWA